MTQEIELVVFENVSVMHQKALSLPFGKVSLRQLLMLSAGMLGAVITYSITGEIVYPAIVFAAFVALGMVSTKVLTLDQMIKSMISFLIRGTSLSRKPQYMIDEKKKNKSAKTRILDGNENDQQLNAEKPANNKNIIENTISQIESLFGKKSQDTKEEDYDDSETKPNSTEDKRYSLDIILEEKQEDDDMITSTTQLQISNVQDNFYDYAYDTSNQSILDKIISMITNKKNISSNQNELIPEVVSIYLNGTKIAATDYVINEKDGSVSIPLNDDSKYSVIVRDEKNTETIVSE
ncbi:hypothetical protein [Nitrosopumilus sp.]|uniref:hypothetical protein n=1 Tax=Nitrosopumilus sp. TaxID=2024843 RepID=UPI00292EDBE7|nr:hypothetical protein [Nitrosopumilus sp.]